AADLAAARIDVVCAPVLDVATAAMTDAIGDRALSADPNLVTRLGRTMIEAFQASGVYPVIKHCPGHGRAVVDSHLELPQVKTSRRALEDCDFIPFRANNDTRFAMTAHIVYEALDPLHPASQSSRVIKDIIRDHLGFRGILLSDDISMEALSGGLVERSQRAIDAGCDLVVHCTGDFAEMRTLLQEMPLVDERVRAGLLEAADRPRNLEIAERPRLEELERHLQRLA
ncbi:MAG: glycoside hydrolase family 3 N-terminal domain-containing protein, partial [Pseudomonadota bacterium]